MGRQMYCVWPGRTSYAGLWGPLVQIVDMKGEGVDRREKNDSMCAAAAIRGWNNARSLGCGPKGFGLGVYGSSRYAGLQRVSMELHADDPQDLISYMDCLAEHIIATCKNVGPYDGWDLKVGGALDEWTPELDPSGPPALQTGKSSEKWTLTRKRVYLSGTDTFQAISGPDFPAALCLARELGSLPPSNVLSFDPSPPDPSEETPEQRAIAAQKLLW